MNRIPMLTKRVPAVCIVSLFVWSSTGRGQAWISFVEDPTRISADISVIEDVPCSTDPECTGTCDSNGNFPCDNQCACACEKDMAFGDLDGDGDDDLIIVRIQPFETQGGVSNLLFMNENRTMVDRTDLAEGFADLTQDRDVVIVDVNPIPDNPLPDVVIATTYGEQPRVYMNLGCCSTACSPSSPCAPPNQVACDPLGSPAWCGLKYEASDNRIPAFTPAPRFCGVAAGDLDNDGCDDLYFTDYENGLEDRMLLNIKTGGVCTGFFTDVTTTPSTRLCPGGPPCFNKSGFGTGARIVDVDLDGFNDIVKSDASPDGNPLTEDGTVMVLYNDPTNVGHFDIKQDLSTEFADIGDLYMFAANDMNADGGVDLYAVRAEQGLNKADKFLINKCFQADPLPAECDQGDGTVKFKSPKKITGSNRTDYPGGNVALVDLDGDSFRDVLLADVDVPGSFCNNTMRVMHTTVNVGDPLIVTVNDAQGNKNCAWNTNKTYDFAVFDINGDGKRDLWSGHAGGNQVFIWEAPSDCDADGVPDRCITQPGQVPGIEVPEEACCMTVGRHRFCLDTFESCCDAAGGLFQSGFTCSSVLLPCPETE